MTVYERFKNGIERLSDEWGRPCAALRRGDVAWAGDGWLGVTQSDQLTADGVRVVVKNTDVFLKCGGDYLPQKEDVLTFDDDGSRYIVTQIGGELWRWSDATKSTMRVHVQEIK